jgi:hypothetical protein
MPWPRLDLDQIVRLDHRRHVAIDELAPVVVHDPRPGVFTGSSAACSSVATDRPSRSISSL